MTQKAEWKSLTLNLLPSAWIALKALSITIAPWLLKISFISLSEYLLNFIFKRKNYVS